MLKTINEQAREIERLKQRLEKEQGHRALNSKNSSKPPSTDGYRKPNPKSQRPTTNRSTGGQKGHKGHTRCQTKNPDRIERDDPKVCQRCGLSLTDRDANHVEKRQEQELIPFLLTVTEYQVSTKVCTCGHVNKGQFPEQIRAPVQYGPRVKALNTYFNQYHLIPYQRTAAIMRDVFQVNLSEGTIRNHLHQFGKIVTPFDKKVAQKIRGSDVAHFDETSLNINAKNNWLHVASTAILTHYSLDEKRGRIAMDNMNILPNFNGTAIHDHWKSYFDYDCQHALCNAHHLRELTFIFEQYENQDWANHMITFLVDSKRKKDLIINSGGRAFSKTELNRLTEQYDSILHDGLDKIPKLSHPSGKRGRKKQHKAKNLWDRLTLFKDETLAFLYDFQIPFDNNQGERDIRMMKTKQKISGCFRKIHNGQLFCKSRGFISTSKKLGLNPFFSISDAFNGMLPSLA